MSHENNTFMIARTRKGDPVWRTNKKGRPFLLEEDGQTKKPLLRLLWRWRLWPSKLHHLPEPHLTYSQVALAHVKAKKVLQALQKGPIRMDQGFLKSYSNKILMTRDLFPARLPIVAVAAFLVIFMRFGRRRAWRQMGYALAGWAAGLRGERGPPAWISV